MEKVEGRIADNLTQTRSPSKITVVVRKLPKYGASHARMTLVPAFFKSLLMEYARCTIRFVENGVLQLSVK